MELGKFGRKGNTKVFVCLPTPTPGCTCDLSTAENTGQRD